MARTIQPHMQPRHAVRVLLKSPGFVFAATLTLALAIGANVAIFSLLKSVILTPLPYGDAGGLVMIWNLATPGDRTWLSAPEVVSFQDDAETFIRVGGYVEADANLTGGDTPERVPAAAVTGELFETLQVRASLGRTLGPADSAPGAPETVVLGHDLWVRRFGGVPSILGQRIEINGRLREVVGVMPSSFHLPVDYRDSRATELWIAVPIDRANLGQWGNRSLLVVARLAPGATAEQATSELAVLEDRWLAAGYIQRSGDQRLARTAVPLQDFVTGRVRRPLFILMGAVGLVLLIACANVVNLLLARADSRRREMALRAALGAERGHILRQSLIESAFLSILGAGAGLVLAHAALHVLKTLWPVGLPRVQDVTLDASVLVFTIALAVVCAGIFGLTPAVQTARHDLAAVLNAAGRGGPPGRARVGVRRALVVVQLAVSVTLVIAAGLLLRSLIELHRIDLGFDDRNVLTAQLQLPSADYADAERVVDFYRQVIDRLARTPGVAAAGGVRLLPLARSIGDWSITIEGREMAPGDNPNADFQFATPGYFHAMGLSLVKGRWLTEADRDNAPLVVLINDTMAARYWPHDDPIGERFRMGGVGSTRPMMTIVGVVKASRHNAVVEEPRAEMYLPHSQLPASAGIGAARTMALVVKTVGDPLGLAGVMRQAVREVNPNIPVADIQTMEQVTAKALAGPRFAAFLLGVFALLALTLAAVGTYATISLLVSQRSNEIGIRMALGAARSRILVSVLAEGIGFAAAGVAIGLLGAFFAAGVLEALLYGVSTLDPVTFTVVPALLAVVALLAAWVPAYRAASVDPLTTLREG